MTKITTDFVGSETIAVTKQRLTDILAYWGASTAAYTTWGQARTALNALLTSTTAGTIGSTELAGTFLPKINFLNDPDDVVLDALFGAGEQGVWLDPSDLTTMFQDAAGTTPVTAPGQPVGLRLDKSKGLALGADTAVNGSFATDTGWTKDAGWTIASGKASASGSAGYLYQNGSAAKVVGSVYKITFTVSDYVSGNVIPYISGVTPTGTPFNSNGDKTVYLRATSTNAEQGFAATGAGASFSIDNYVVREIAGNHATQSTLGSRPMYGIEPKGGRRNLLTWSEGFDVTATWTNPVVPVAVTANTTLAPDGTLTADKLVPPASTNVMVTRQTFTFSATTYVMSVWAKLADAGVHLELLAAHSAGACGAVFNLSTGAVLSSANCTTAISADNGNGWRRYSVIFIAVAGSNPFDVRVTEASTRETAMAGNGSKGIFVWGAQLETGSTATNYQRVTTAFDVTEAGVNSCHYCQYDGIDDFVETQVDANTLLGVAGADPGYLVAAGVKYNTAGGSIIAYSRAAFCGDTAGFFAMWAHTVNGGEAGIYQWDSGIKTAERAYTVGSSAVFTGRRNPSEGVAGKIYASVNGVSSAGTEVAALNPSAGKFVIGKQFVGAFMNGRDYGIIVTGKLANATAIATTEMYLANKTPGVTL